MEPSYFLMNRIVSVWGLLLAHSQNTLYLSDTNEMRQQAALMAYYYIILAVASLVSSTFEFWCPSTPCNDEY